MKYLLAKKYLSLFLIVFVLTAGLMAIMPSAQVLADSALNNTIKSLDTTAKNSGLRTDATITLQIANIISFVLGFLGVIFLVLIVYGGFQWMTAGGNSEQVKKAQSLMINAAIGMAIVLFAYLIVNFVYYQLQGRIDPKIQ